MVLLQEQEHFRRWHILRDEGLPYAMRQDEGERAPADLLVLRDIGEKPLGIGQAGRNVGKAHRQPDRAKMRLDAGRVVGACQVEPGGKAMRQGHADGDALAVHEPGRIIAGQLFQGVAKSMPEVEERPLTLFCFVGGDDAACHWGTTVPRMIKIMEKNYFAAIDFNLGAAMGAGLFGTAMWGGALLGPSSGTPAGAAAGLACLSSILPAAQ